MTSPICLRIFALKPWVRHRSPQTASKHYLYFFYSLFLNPRRFCFVKLSASWEKWFWSQWRHHHVKSMNKMRRAETHRWTAHDQWAAEPGSKPGRQKTFFGVFAGFAIAIGLNGQPSLRTVSSSCNTTMVMPSRQLAAAVTQNSHTVNYA